jgi:hypothetical protein
MPIVSKRRWGGQFMDPIAASRPDSRLLICAMGLLIWSPMHLGIKLSPRTNVYLEIKRSLLDAENLGLFTLPLLQCMVLTSVYEIGHAIYPAGYMSIGHCVKMGLALGLEKLSHQDLKASAYDADEQEERKRVWWAIIILDR